MPKILVVTVALLLSLASHLTAQSQRSRADGNSGRRRPASAPSISPAAATFACGADSIRMTTRVMPHPDSGRSYRIYTAVPSAPKPLHGFPVMYLLDANWNIRRMIDAVCNRTVGSQLAIVIGIGYDTDERHDIVMARAFDYTPPPLSIAADSADSVDSVESTPALPLPRVARASRPGGGAESFARFIRTELQPWVAAEFPVDTSRQTIYGHSYGGLFVLYLLYTQPNTFQTYFAASPSIWYGNRVLTRYERMFRDSLVRSIRGRRRVFITVGELERRRATTDTVTANIPVVSEAQRMAHRLAALGIPSLSTDFYEFAGEGHGSVIGPSIRRSASTLEE